MSNNKHQALPTAFFATFFPFTHPKVPVPVLAVVIIKIETITMRVLTFTEKANKRETPQPQSNFVLEEGTKDRGEVNESQEGTLDEQT
jgi:hypothetical protein